MRVQIKSDSIVMVDIDAIRQHPKNRNTHPQDQIDRLANVIAYQGFRDPLIVSKRSGLLISGHGRVMAAKQLGMTQIPVTMQDFEDDAQEYAALVSENAVASWAELDLSGINTDLGDLGPDFDVDLLGIKGFEIEVADKVLGDEDDVPEVPVEPKTRLGDIYQLGAHRLMCGDSTSIVAVEKLMGGENADMGFCDPPYNLGFEYNEYDDNKSSEEYSEFSKLWFSNLQIVSKRQIVTLGTKNIPIMANLGVVAGVACWVKKNWITSCHISKLQQWEPIFFYGDYTKLKRTSDLFEINRVFQKDVGNDHTCPKQIELIKDIFGHYCEQSVVDLFGGSGTSMIAAESLGLKSYLMELDPRYCDVIVARWEKYTGKKAELISG